MSKIIKLLSTIFLFFFVSCTVAQPLPQSVSETINCPYFDSIRSNGIINVEVVVGQTKQSVEVIGDPEVLKDFTYHVDNQTLVLTEKSMALIKHYIHVPQEYITVRINLQNLSDIVHDGYGNFTVTGLPIHLMRLDYDGSGIVKILWVDSPALRVHANGSGSVALAGVTNILNVDAFNSAHVNLRYLRADTVFVKTHQHAAVDVFPHINLFALAEDYSDIYYYQEPHYLNQIMRQSGSILAMHDIPNALMTFDSSPYTSTSF